MADPRFARFAAIDWSGALGHRQKGIAVAICDQGDAAPRLVAPSDGGAWSREDILLWLLGLRDVPILIGLDLSPGFPFVDEGAYFPGWPGSPPDAKALWHLVDTLCVDDPHLSAVGFLRHADAARHFRHQRATGDLFPGGRGRLRRCEERQRAMMLSPSSCFNLIGAAQVGKSSLTGMRVLARLDGQIPVWPFDLLPATGPAIVEIYTSLAARAAGLRPGRSKIRDAATLDAALLTLNSQRHLPLRRYDDHATDALLTAAWLRQASRDATLWHPPGLTDPIAATEGWTFGVR